MIIPGFWIYHGSKYEKFSEGSEYACEYVRYA